MEGSGSLKSGLVHGMLEDIEVGKSCSWCYYSSTIPCWTKHSTKKKLIALESHNKKDPNRFQFKSIPRRQLGSKAYRRKKQRQRNVKLIPTTDSNDLDWIPAGSYFISQPTSLTHNRHTFCSAADQASANRLVEVQYARWKRFDMQNSQLPAQTSICVL